MGTGILWGYPQDFLWVWDGYGDRNSVPTAALLSGPTGGAYNTGICTPEKSYEMLHRRLVHVGKTLTGLQILGCELHQNAFGGRALPGPTGGAIALPRPFSRY